MAEPRRIAVLTTGRQDYAILRSTALALSGDARFDLRLLVGGMHLREQHGRTIDMVRADGLPIAEELVFDDINPAKEFASTVEMVTAAITRHRPQALLLVGDRTETLAAAVAATLSLTPIVHLHGGEESEGAVDNACRHAITKLAHLHLVSHELHAARVRQMGEPDEQVVVVGAPGLDNLYRDDLPDRVELQRFLGIPLTDPIVIVTLHPTTLSTGDPDAEVQSLCDAMEKIDATYVITLPNSDPGEEVIRRAWSRWAQGRSNVSIVAALGAERYWALLRIARAMLGNSSSGLIEAPSAGVPVVDVGDRQKGRLAPAHVVRVPFDRGEITAALAEAISDERHAQVMGLPPLYPTGNAAQRIVEVLASERLSSSARKRFVDRTLLVPLAPESKRQ